jgi:uncharacterized damage-inducible protein DinB
MRPIEHYETLLMSRRRMQDWARELTPDQYRQAFPFGHKSVGGTLAHLVGTEWLYGRAVRGEEFDSRNLPYTEATHPDYASLEAAWRELESSTRGWLLVETDWTRRIERIGNTATGKRVRNV